MNAAPPYLALCQVYEQIAQPILLVPWNLQGRVDLTVFEDVQVCRGARLVCEASVA